MTLINNRLSLLINALFVLLCTSSVALSAATNADEAVRLPSGGERPLTVEDLRPHRPTGGAFNEVWTYSFFLNDGMQATLSLSYAELGSLMAPVSGGEFSVAGFDGAAYRVAKEYDADDLAFSETNHRLAVGHKIYFEGELPRRHRVHFEGSKSGKDFYADFTFSDIAPGLTWGDGVFHLGRERLGLFLHIPYARVTGTIRVDGVEKQVRGTAMMDHTFQTTFAPKLVRGAFRYAQHEGQKEVGYVIAPHSRYEDRVIGIGAVQEGGRFRLRKPTAAQVVSTQRARGAEVPRQLAIRFERGKPVILNRERDRQAFSALEELSGLQKTIVRRYIGGEVMVFRGRGVTNQRHQVGYDYLIVR